jgi:hypothetical protein
VRAFLPHLHNATAKGIRAGPEQSGDHLTDALRLADQRALIGSTILDVLRAYSLAHYGTERIGENLEEILIGCALIIGQAEGSPMSASDVSGFLGIPRATVDRKLKTAVAQGRLKPQRDGRRVQYVLVNHSDPQITGQIEKIINRLQLVCQKLSKMGDSSVAN